jgi:hypothetical protein
MFAKRVIKARTCSFPFLYLERQAGRSQLCCITGQRSTLLADSNTNICVLVSLVIIVCVEDALAEQNNTLGHISDLNNAL